MTYLLGDEEGTDRIDALDAALAVAAVGATGRRLFDRFEWLAVQLVGAPTSSGSPSEVDPAPTNAPSRAAGAGDRFAVAASTPAAEHHT